MSAERHDLLARIPGCARLAPEAMAALAQATRLEEHGPGVKLVVEGEPAPDWYLVLERGAIQLSRLDVEADEILDYLTAGDVFDPGTPGQPAAVTATVSETTRCLLVPQSVVARHRGSLALDLVTHGERELPLLRQRVQDLVKGGPVTCQPTASVAEAARLMTERGVGSVGVVDREGAPLGIVTDRDLRIKILAAGLPSTTRVVDIMSSPLLSVHPSRPAFEALLEMIRRDVHHIGVVDDRRLVGMISSHDIVLVQGSHPVGLMRQIDAQSDIEGLAILASRVQTVVRWLAGHGAKASDIGRIVAELNDRLVRRALALVEVRLDVEGYGRPPVPYAWLAAGSEGRREQTLKTDQDNGLLYQDAPGELAPRAADYFGRLAGAMGDALEILGFPPCPGGFMASNPRWCQPEAVWRGYFSSWMEAPHPGQVLDASLFFDLRPIAGHDALGRGLWEWVCGQAPSHRLFLSYMAKAALERHVPLGFFGRFVVDRSGTHRDMLDLKARGVFPMTQGMRVLALSVGVSETNTLDRLRIVASRGLLSSAETDDLGDAHELISRIRLDHQLACLDAGKEPDNFIDPNTLRKSDRVLLKEAFKTLAHLQELIADRFRTDLLA